MGKILTFVGQFLERDGWPYEMEEGALRLRYSGKHGYYSVSVEERLEERRGYQVVIDSFCPVNIPPERRLVAVEFLGRANFSVSLGQFELISERGEIRYRTSLDVFDGELSDNLFRPLLYTNIHRMDFFLPGLLAVLYGRTTPREAMDILAAGGTL
ncbi:hypothetical protein DYH09_10920 [bacterium CPR1]|nr:hypothetical protein [bacterium CPR1]